ncbi:MAG: hypothetical protein KAS13_06355 [Candidatus Omnitrophica bacterium]|nr:hypothetical protein [Candidatus Omnitrophota bacterium]
MRKILSMLVIFMALGFFLTSRALCHTPLCSCYDNGDETITCEGGFSDGSSAAGTAIKVVNKNGEVISVKDEDGKTVFLEGKMDEDSEFTFIKPQKAYKVVFDAGPGHAVEIDGDEITE